MDFLEPTSTISVEVEAYFGADEGADEGGGGGGGCAKPEAIAGAAAKRPE